MLSQFARPCSTHILSSNTRRHLTLHAHRAPEPAAPEISQLVINYIKRPAKPLRLSKLLAFARPVTPDSVLESVEYVQSEIPRRMASRVAQIEALPFIVGTNPYIARTLHACRKSFLWLATQPKVTTLEQNQEYTQHLATLVENHSDDIPTMARGCKECTRYMTPTVMANFLDAAIRDRINIRLLAEEHVAITRVLEDHGKVDDFYGVVNSHCSPLEVIRLVGGFVSDLCEATLGAAPKLEINGHPDATFAYVPVHLQYIMTELLKNAFRATVEHHYKTYGEYSSHPIPPVQVTISPSPTLDAPNGHPGGPYLSIRIRDQGGGVSAANMARIFSYAFTTAGRQTPVEETEDDVGGGPYAAQHVGGSAAIDPGSAGASSLFSDMASKGLQTGLGTIAGLGYGLPMSRLYAKYFGGSLELLSLDGWGSDCVVKLRALDQVADVEI